MGTATIVEDFDKAFELTPVKGHANEYVIRPKTARPGGHAENEMSPADWDKFEKDIADAFEQVP
jgi:hypothetical protein